MSVARPIRLTGQFTLPSNVRREWRLRLVTYAETIRSEPGCLAFDLFEDDAGTGSVTTWEVFRDQAALQAHRDSEHTKQIIADLQAVGIKPKITFLVPIDQE